MNRIDLLVCDFDNTLYNWVAYFVPSFFRMVDEAAAILCIQRSALIDDFREVHKKFGDSEHPFALLETDTVKMRFSHLSREEAAERLDTAFHAFNRSRKETLRLYPGVSETLAELTDRGVRLVGHTEARYLAVRDRLSRLGLARFFDTVYCRERVKSSRPRNGTGVVTEMRTHLIELSHHQAKPSPEVLTEICEREGVAREHVAYVGDSLFKDILMANRAGVMAIWAEYGTAHPAEYEQLVQVSHWTDADIQLEKELRLSAGSIQPDATLRTGFAELLDIVPPQ